MFTFPKKYPLFGGVRFLKVTIKGCFTVNTCVAIFNPVLSLFIDLNTEPTLRLSVSRFFVTVLTATCHTCELQFFVLGLLADLLVNEYGHSSSNLSRI